MIEVIMDWIVRPVIFFVTVIGVLTSIRMLISISNNAKKQIEKERQERLDKTVRK